MIHKHKHCELIKLWADGHEVQYWNDNKWVDTPEPVWDSATAYRLKADAWKDDILKAIKEGKTVEILVGSKWVEADALHRLVRQDELEHYDWKTEHYYRIRQDPVYVFAYSQPNADEWYISGKLLTESDAKEHFTKLKLKYKKLQTI